TWMYNWSRSPSEVHADAPGTGYVKLSDEKTRTAVGDSDIVATNLQTFSSATAAHPDRFTARPYSLILTLTDADSLKSATLTFQGVLDGQITAQSANLRNTFTGPTSYTIVLGNHSYTATVGPYTPPGPPGSNLSGAISGHTTIDMSVVTVVSTPEPAALAL